MNRIITANLAVVLFPGPQVDFLEDPEEGVAVQMDLKKKEDLLLANILLPQGKFSTLVSISQQMCQITSREDKMF